MFYFVVSSSCVHFFCTLSCSFSPVFPVSLLSLQLHLVPLVSSVCIKPVVPSLLVMFPHVSPMSPPSLWFVLWYSFSLSLYFLFVCFVPSFFLHFCILGSRIIKGSWEFLGLRMSSIYVFFGCFSCFKSSPRLL